MQQSSMPSAIESAHQVPRLKRFLWGLGGFTDATIIYGMYSLVSAIYINALGANAVLISLACAIPRFLDSVSDPLVGHLSDNTRSRWGRRRPWLLAGLVMSAIFGMLLWYAPLSNPIALPHSALAPTEITAEATESAQTRSNDSDDIAVSGERKPWWKSTTNAIATDWKAFVYLSAVMTLLMAVGYTLFNVPHYAMGYEMTTDYNERTHIFKWRFVSFAAAGFMTPWLMPLCMWFEGDQAQMLRGSQGVIYVSIIVAIIILATGIPSLFCRERVIVKKQKAKIPLSHAIRLTFHNKPFLLLLASNFIARFGMAITGIFFYYVFIYHIGKGNQLQGVALLAVFFNTINIANFIAMAPIASLSSRIGKKPTLLLMLAMSSVAYASLLFTFSNSDGSFLSHTFHFGAASWTLSMQWPSIITAVLIGVFTNTMPMLTNSMIADICDYDELQCGERREGFYGAVYTSIEKIALSVSLVFQGVLLVASGFNAALNIQSPETIRYWILALVVTQPIGFLIGIILMLFYPLTRARAEEIRRELELSRNSADAAISG
ncbi:MAG: MFS transporter [bacterium]|jgi:GPH family glycoside/pentoside/hexuronide:cation symporter|nr:MFS transporter [bacterium]